jgi:hypothetical protein
VRIPAEHGPSSSHLVGQFPSHTSDGSMTLLPHTGLQSLSDSAVARGGQHPSPLLATTMATLMHAALQSALEPTSIPFMHPLFPSGHDVGQSPSQISPGSTTRLPHCGRQSLSFFAFAPAGQQPSPPFGDVMGAFVQTALHCAALPVSFPLMHASSWSHVLGQLPSQTSGGSTTSFPQDDEQSLSLLAFAPLGQHPSPPFAAVIATLVHFAVHCVGEPDSKSPVHGSWSSHDVGQSPSQISGGSIVPLPQVGEQSVSVFIVSPGKQQPSPAVGRVIAV